VSDTDTLTRPVGGTITEDETRAVPHEPGDHDKFAHYVAKDKLLESQVTGMPVVAFCGKIWVPKDDPSKYPVCPSCVEKKARMDRRFAN